MNHEQLLYKLAQQQGRQALCTGTIGVIESIIRSDISPSAKVAEIGEVLDAFKKLHDNKSLPWRT